MIRKFKDRMRSTLELLPNKNLRKHYPELFTDDHAEIFKKN